MITATLGKGNGAPGSAVPGVAGWEGTRSVVRMHPSASRIFAAIREGEPLGGAGTQAVRVEDHHQAGYQDEVHAVRPRDGGGRRSSSLPANRLDATIPAPVDVERPSRGGA